MEINIEILCKNNELLVSTLNMIKCEKSIMLLGILNSNEITQENKLLISKNLLKYILIGHEQEFIANYFSKFIIGEKEDHQEDHEESDQEEEESEDEEQDIGDIIDNITKKNNGKTQYLIASLKTGIMKENCVEQTSIKQGIIADIKKKEGFKEYATRFFDQPEIIWKNDVVLIDSLKIRWSDHMYSVVIDNEAFLIVVDPIMEYKKVE